MAVLSQLAAFRGQDAILDFAEFHFKFPITGIVDGIGFGILNIYFIAVKSGPNFAGKEKGTRNTHRPDGIQFVGIK